MPAKKTTKKTDFDKKVENVSDKLKDEAKVVGAESKRIAKGLGSRRERSSRQEKVSVILGIILLIRGLYILRSELLGFILIILGLLGMTKFFVKK